MPIHSEPVSTYGTSLSSYMPVLESKMHHQYNFTYYASLQESE